MPRCSQCDYMSDKTSNLRRHIDKVHSSSGKNVVIAKNNYQCQSCDKSTPDRQELIHHYTSDHNVVISKKELEFDNETSFLNWKAAVEKSTTSRFILFTGTRQRKNYKTARYICHRDGFFSSVSTGKRHLKLLGSNKINSCCPARMTAIIMNDSGAVTVEFVETHVGHSHDLERLRLTKDERREMTTLSKKVVDIRRCHEEALNMDDTVLTKTTRGWTISSSSFPEYEIVLSNADCSCALQCDDCEVCIHRYQCDCPDASVKKVMCRHIHYVAMNSARLMQCSDTELIENSLDILGEDDLIIDDHCIGKTQDLVIEELPQTTSTDLKEEQNVLIECFRAIVMDTKSIEELEIFKKALVDITSKIESSRCNDGTLTPTRQEDTEGHFTAESEKTDRREQ